MGPHPGTDRPKLPGWESLPPAIALEFTVTFETAIRMVGRHSIASQDEQNATRPIRFRVVVPSAHSMGGTSQEGVAAYFQYTNLFDELVWEQLGNQAPVVGGFHFWHRTVIALAFHALALSTGAR